MPTVERPIPSPSGHCQPGCVRLSAHLRDLFQLGDSGCYNPSSRTQSGGASFHVHGQAIDLTANWHDPAEQVRGNAAMEWAIRHADELNLQEAIFGHRIITARRWSQGVRFYAPTDHENHVHIAVGALAAANWTASEGDDWMATLSDDEKNELLTAARKVNGTIEPFVNELKALTPVRDKPWIGFFRVFADVNAFVNQLKAEGPFLWSNWFGRG